MIKPLEKPSPEAKALSLFLIPYKTINPIYKEKSKQINKRCDLLMFGKLSRKKYNKEVLSMLNLYGGYSEVIEKTVSYYIEKTGEWKLERTGKYCKDTKLIVERILKNNSIFNHLNTK